MYAYCNPQCAHKLTVLAQLPLHLDHGLRRCPDGNMGRSIEVSSSGQSKGFVNTKVQREHLWFDCRRFWWVDLVLYWRLHRIRLCIRVHVRTGFDVSTSSHITLPSNSDCRAPTSGGQYHWVSEFAPREYQKFLSYITGTEDGEGRWIEMFLTN